MVKAKSFPLEPRANAALSAVTGGVVAGEPPGCPGWAVCSGAAPLPRRPGSLRGQGTGGLSLHQPAAARPQAQAAAGPSTQRSRCPQTDESKAQIQGWPGDLRPKQDDRGDRIRPDQRCKGAGSLPVARVGEGGWGMGADHHLLASAQRATRP